MRLVTRPRTHKTTMNPIPENELDGRRKGRRAAAFHAIISIALCLAASKPTAAQQKNETSLTTAQLEELLDKASALSEKYKTLKSDKGFPVEMFLNGRITSEYGPFRRFEVGARHDNVPNKDDK
jgi:hypothetical protein